MSRNLTRAWYVPSRNFEKFPFNWSFMLTVDSLNVTKGELVVKFLEGALKLTENFKEVISNGVPYQKLTNLQTAAVGLVCF